MDANQRLERLCVCIGIYYKVIRPRAPFNVCHVSSVYDTYTIRITIAIHPQDTLRCGLRTSRAQAQRTHARVTSHSRGTGEGFAGGGWCLLSSRSSLALRGSPLWTAAGHNLSPGHGCAGVRLQSATREQSRVAVAPKNPATRNPTRNPGLLSPRESCNPQSQTFFGLSYIIYIALRQQCLCSY